MNSENLTIQFLPKQNFKKGQDFYTSVGYLALIHPNDLVLVAYSNSEIIGIVRISYENDVAVLRGMMIAPSFQQKGVGSLMLKHLESAIDQDCFCLPHAWLEYFYGQIGFKKIDEKRIPVFLSNKFEENKKKYPYLIVMQRESRWRRERDSNPR